MRRWEYSRDLIYNARWCSYTLLSSPKLRSIFGLGAKKTPGPTTSVAEENNQYRAAELERTRTFLRAEQKRELEFLKAEVARKQSEDVRNEEFTRLLDENMDTFRKNQKAREVAFLEEAAKQEELFRSSEEARDRSFEEFQSKREQVFQESQEHRRKTASWYSQLREGIQTKGREEREKVVDELIKSLRKQFDEFIKAEEAAFAAAQNRRDTIILEMVSFSPVLRRYFLIDNCRKRGPIREVRKRYPRR